MPSKCRRKWVYKDCCVVEASAYGHYGLVSIARQKKVFKPWKIITYICSCISQSASSRRVTSISSESHTPLHSFYKILGRFAYSEAKHAKGGAHISLSYCC